MVVKISLPMTMTAAGRVIARLDKILENNCEMKTILSEMEKELTEKAATK